MHVQLRKCEFLTDHLEYLGHIVDREGIRVDLVKIKAVLENPKP